MGDSETAVFPEVSSVAARASAVAAMPACRTGGLALNSFLADSSTWPSACEASGACLWSIVRAFSGAVCGALSCVDTASGRTNVRSASGVWPAERSTKDKTTPPPAVAPTAVATSTARTVRKKLGAGARQPHTG